MSFLLSFFPLFWGLVWSNASLLKRAKRYTFWQSGWIRKIWAIYRDFDGNSLGTALAFWEYSLYYVVIKSSLKRYTFWDRAFLIFVQNHGRISWRVARLAKGPEKLHKKRAGTTGRFLLGSGDGL